MCSTFSGVVYQLVGLVPGATRTSLTVPGTLRSQRGGGLLKASTVPAVAFSTRTLSLVSEVPVAMLLYLAFGLDQYCTRGSQDNGGVQA